MMAPDRGDSGIVVFFLKVFFNSQQGKGEVVIVAGTYNIGNGVAIN